jgi:hypothetical protein
VRPTIVLAPVTVGNKRKRCSNRFGRCEPHGNHDLHHPPLHLRECEVLVAVVYRLNFAAIDRNAGVREQAQAATEHNEPGADLADGTGICSCGNPQSSL